MNPQRRRWFLQLAARLAVLGGGGSLLQRALAGEIAPRPGAARRLVLVELTGANDGLNTLVPHGNDHYYRLRPTLALPADELVMLQGDHTAGVGLHDALQPLMPLWDHGELAWVQGLGYPLPNRSHFKSIALWESGGDGAAEGRDGWITHDLEHRLARPVADVHGISLAGSLALFASDGGRWLSMRDARQYLTAPSLLADDSAAVRSPALSIVRERRRQLDRIRQQLAGKLAAVDPVRGFGGGALGQQLRSVAELIRAGIDAPVYRVQIGSFDTHANQLGRHRTLLSQLATAVAGFRAVLVESGHWQDTLLMSYSEFGRRAAENRSGGTDHGTAAPHFVCGGAVRGGLYGEAPSLSRLHRDDLEYTLDYRALYRQLLAEGFGIDGNRFEHHADARLDGLIVRA